MSDFETAVSVLVDVKIKGLLERSLEAAETAIAQSKQLLTQRDHLAEMISRAELLARTSGGECPWCRRLLGFGGMGHKDSCDALPFVGKVT